MATRIIPREDLDRVVDVEVRPKGEKEAVAKVTDFLDELALEKEEGDVEVHLIQQSRASANHQNIVSFQVRAGEDMNEVAVQIVDAAVIDARDAMATGKVRYAINASGRRGRKSFTLIFPDVGDEENDELPNERGVLAQAMADKKELQRLLVDLVHDVTRTQKGMIADLVMSNRKHQEIAVQNWQTYGDLMAAQHERQLGLIKAERGEKRMDEVAGFLMTAGQIVFNTFMGKRIFDKAPTPVEHLTYATMSLFTEEQANAMINGAPVQLRTEQALGLMKLFQALDEHYKAQKGAAEPGAKAYAPPALAESPPPYANGHTNGTTNGANGSGQNHPPPADPASAAT
jgi:hypothetical protein